MRAMTAMQQQPSPPNPGAGAMAVQQDPEGDQMESRVAIVGAMQVLDRQVLKWEPGSKEAKYILKARKALTRVAGKQEEDAEQLSPALMKLYLSELLGPQNPPQPPQGAAPQPPPGMGAAPLGPGAPMGGMAPQW
jgi:hypothetical protein